MPCAVAPAAPHNKGIFRPAEIVFFPLPYYPPKIKKPRARAGGMNASNTPLLAQGHSHESGLGVLELHMNILSPLQQLSILN